MIWYDRNSGGLKDFRSTSYSCLLLCRIQYIRDRCGCTPAIMPDLHPMDANNEHNHLLCGLTNMSDPHSYYKMILNTNCELNSYDKLNTIKKAGTHPPCVAECPWECNSLEYFTDVSYNQWPVNEEVSDFLKIYMSGQNSDYRNILHYKYNGSFDQYFEKNQTTDVYSIIQEIWDNASENMTTIVDKLQTKIQSMKVIPNINPQHLNLSSIEQAEIKWVRDNFYRVNIYFKDPVVQVHKQVLDYSATDFCSALGGILGLWAGVSIITVIELLEFLANLINILFENPKNTTSTAKVKIIEEKS